MIPGIEKFEERFVEDAGVYVIIGGAARELIFAEAGLWVDTATKDLPELMAFDAALPNALSRGMRENRPALIPMSRCHLVAF